MIKSHNYNGVCWICGAKADSSEHVFKSSEFRSVYKKQLAPGELLFYSNGGGAPSHITSYKDPALKFGKVLCKQCNGTFTQPHDEAYSLFYFYLRENKRQIFKDQYVDLMEVFGPNWLEQKLNLFKYIAKHVGCNLAKGNLEVPETLVKFIRNDVPLLEGIFVFQLHAFIADLEDAAKQTGRTYLHMFYSPTFTLSFTENQPVTAAFGWTSMSFLTITWVVSDKIPYTKKYQSYLDQRFLPLRIRPLNLLEPYEENVDTAATIIPKIEYCDRSKEAEVLVTYVSNIIKELAD